MGKGRQSFGCSLSSAEVAMRNSTLSHDGDWIGAGIESSLLPFWEELSTRT
jgi:hypothetical protein